MSFLEESAATLPLLLLEGVNLHAKSIRSLGHAYAGEGSLDRAGQARSALHDLLRFDLLAVAVRHGVGFHRSAAAVFGLYMGATFSPNHKGMPPFRAAAPVHAQLPP